MRSPEFLAYQAAFTQHTRDPRKHPRPARVSARRMRVYNELLFGNFRGFLDACFPVTRELLGDVRWTRLARRFFATHRCASPLFRQIPEEFVGWLRDARHTIRMADYVPHLVHYEWVELALDVMPDESPEVLTDRQADLLAGHPVLNPVSRLLEYPYAVHRIGPAYRPRPNQREHTTILAFRDANDEVRFIVMNAVSALLVRLLRDGEPTGRDALERIAVEIGHPDPEIVLAGGAEILDNLRAEGAIVGSRAPGRNP
ncbi:MAG: DUF2063 domain-containing protein [Betaproteobacteria bacterium]|nr:DUF2063 domain-containing protein [Betaproteobacteria bacterium]